MKYIYNTSQMLKLNLILHTFSITGLVVSLFLTSKQDWRRDSEYASLITRFRGFLISIRFIIQSFGPKL